MTVTEYLQWVEVRDAAGALADPADGVGWKVYAATTTGPDDYVLYGVAQRHAAGLYLVAVPIDGGAGLFQPGHAYAVLAEYTLVEGEPVTVPLGAFTATTTDMDALKEDTAAVRALLPADGALAALTQARVLALDNLLDAGALAALITAAVHATVEELIYTAPTGTDPRNVGAAGTKVNYARWALNGSYVYRWYHYEDAAAETPYKVTWSNLAPGENQ